MTVFLTFCSHRLEHSLDNHRRLAKNTHELIVLPVFGRFFRPTGIRVTRLLVPNLACGRGTIKPQSGKLRAASMPPGLFWARGFRRNLGFGVFGFRSFDPDQTSTADRRYTSARDLTAGWLGCRVARRTIKRARESRTNFARADSCAHDARIHLTSRLRPANNTSTKANLARVSFQDRTFIAAHGRTRSHTICFLLQAPRAEHLNLFAQG
jgi:hypothetical protein